MASLASRASAKTPAGRALLKRALRDPGLRSKLPTNLLPANVRGQRNLNARLDAPITPGSSTTERMLAREAKAAEQVQYGPQQQALGTQLATAQQTQRDTGGYYDQYLAQLAQNQRDVANIQAGAQQALVQTGAGITGLAGADASQLQGQANQAAGARGATAGDLSQMASGAAATRQSLLGSFQAQQALQGAGANTYASGLANVIGPTQKLGALAQGQRQVGKVQSDITALAAQRGAYNQQYRSQQRTAEGKNVIARAALNLKSEGQAATLEESAKKRRSQERQTGARLTSQEQQTQNRLEAQARQGTLNRQNRKELQRLRTKAGKKGGKGPDWRTQEQTGSAMTQLSSLKSMAQKAKAGQPFISGHERQTPADRRGAKNKILGFAPVASKLKDPALVSAALDAAYNEPPHLSAETVRRLIKAGFKPSQVAETLGVPTRQQWERAGKPAGKVTARNVPGLGGTVK